eukprot:jgi/Mesvir1/24849/Mv22085-RA.1
MPPRRHQMSRRGEPPCPPTCSIPSCQLLALLLVLLPCLTGADPSPGGPLSPSRRLSLGTTSRQDAMRTLCRCRLLFESSNLPPASLFDTPLSSPAERSLSRDLWRLPPGKPLTDACRALLSGAPASPCQGVFHVQPNVHSTALLERDQLPFRVLSAAMCRRGWMWVPLEHILASEWDRGGQASGLTATRGDSSAQQASRAAAKGSHGGQGGTLEKGDGGRGHPTGAATEGSQKGGRGGTEMGSAGRQSQGDEQGLTGLGGIKGGQGSSGGGDDDIIPGLGPCVAPLPRLLYMKLATLPELAKELGRMAAALHPQPVVANAHPDMLYLIHKGLFWETIRRHVEAAPLRDRQACQEAVIGGLVPMTSRLFVPEECGGFFRQLQEDIAAAKERRKGDDNADARTVVSSRPGSLTGGGDGDGEDGAMAGVGGGAIAENWASKQEEKKGKEEIADREGKEQKEAEEPHDGNLAGVGAGSSHRGLSPVEAAAVRDVREPWYIVKQSSAWAGRGTYLVVPSLLPQDGGPLALYDHGRRCGEARDEGKGDASAQDSEDAGKSGDASPTDVEGSASDDPTAHSDLLSSNPSAQTTDQGLGPDAAGKGGEAAGEGSEATWEEAIRLREEIAQRYVRDPLLLRDGRKFHLRAYAIVASWHPLLVLFSPGANYFQIATTPYNGADIHNLTGHITNVREDTQPFPRGLFTFSGIPEWAQAAASPDSPDYLTHYQRWDLAHNPAKGWHPPGEDEGWGTMDQLEDELVAAQGGPAGYVGATLVPSMRRAVVLALRALHARMRSLADVTSASGSGGGGGRGRGQYLYSYRLLGFDFMLTSARQLVFLEVNSNPFMIRTPVRVLADMVNVVTDLFEARMRGRWPVPGSHARLGEQMCSDGEMAGKETCVLGPAVTCVLNMTKYSHLEVIIDGDWDAGTVVGCG